MIPIARSVIAVSNQLFQSIPDLFLFSSLICISPPYVYIISYGVPYVKRFFKEYAKKCPIKGTFCISKGKFYDYSQQRQHLLPIGTPGVEPGYTACKAICFSLKLHSVSRRMNRRLFPKIKRYVSVCSCILFISCLKRT